MPDPLRPPPCHGLPFSIVVALAGLSTAGRGRLPAASMMAHVNRAETHSSQFSVRPSRIDTAGAPSDGPSPACPLGRTSAAGCFFAASELMDRGRAWHEGGIRPHFFLGIGASGCASTVAIHFRAGFQLDLFTIFVGQPSTAICCLRWQKASVVTTAYLRGLVHA